MDMKIKQKRFLHKIKMMIMEKGYAEISFVVVDALFGCKDKAQRHNLIHKISKELRLQFNINYNFQLFCLRRKGYKVGLGA